MLDRVFPASATGVAALRALVALALAVLTTACPSTKTLRISGDQNDNLRALFVIVGSASQLSGVDDPAEIESLTVLKSQKLYQAFVQFSAQAGEPPVWVEEYRSDATRADGPVVVKTVGDGKRVAVEIKKAWLEKNKELALAIVVDDVDRGWSLKALSWGDVAGAGKALEFTVRDGSIQ